MAKKNKTSRQAKKQKEKERPAASDGLPGWPGYRTREGRSGYDPIDTRTEAAHTAGTLLQRLFRGEVKHPLSLVLLGVLGLILTTPLILALVEARNGNLLPWNAWIFLVLAGIAGVMILVNFVRNLITVIRR